MDSVSEDIDRWMAHMPSADRAVEEMRQRVGRMARLFDRGLDDVAASHRISRADWAALSVIIRSERACTPSDLAEALGLTSGTITTRIKRLTELGLIESDGAAADARSRPVKATPAGHELWRTATVARTEYESQLVRAALDDEGLAELNGLLASILAALESHLGPGSKHDIPKIADADRP